MKNPQLNKHGELVHLLSIEGLPRSILTQVLDTAASFVSMNDREVKKVPLLRGRTLGLPAAHQSHQTIHCRIRRAQSDPSNVSGAPVAGVGSGVEESRAAARDPSPPASEWDLSEGAGHEASLS